MAGIGGRGNSGTPDMDGYKPSNGSRRDTRGVMASSGYSLPSKDVPLPVSRADYKKIPTNFDLITEDRGARLPLNLKSQGGIVGVSAFDNKGIVGLTKTGSAYGVGLNLKF